MKFSLQSLAMVMTAVACWLALAIKFRTLAILLLPIATLVASAFALYFYGKHRYVRNICIWIAIFSLTAGYVASLGPFYLFAAGWSSKNDLSPIGNCVCCAYDPLMIGLSRHAPGLWGPFHDYYLLEWIEYRRYVFDNLDPTWPYRSL